MSNKILTLDNLYQFFVDQNKTVNFSSIESGKPIVVTTNGNFEVTENDMPGMLKCKLKVCHTETNRNGSHISKENMEKAMPTLKYRPILAYIHQLEDGNFDFYAHNMEIVEDENGEEKIVYTEKQVGCFTADDPYLEYDKEMDKTYVIANAVIPEEYTEAANIIRRKNGTKVSCELVINELSYNAKEKYLDLTDFYFGGTTLLGCDEEGYEIGEGMLGSRLDIADFCHKEPKYDYQEKLIETLDKLNNVLSSFHKTESNEKEGNEDMNSFEETTINEEVVEAEEDSVTVSETEEVTTVEVVEETNSEEEVTEETSDSDETTVEVVETEACGTKKKRKCSLDEEGNASIIFEISHEDVRSALYNLLVVYEEEDNEWYWISNVYDDYFVFETWNGNKLYKQSYSVDGDNVAFSGDRQEMFKMILTESEKIAIEDMRKNYSELKEFKETYEANELKSQKEAVFADEDYDDIRESDGFKNIMAEMDKFSVEEIKAKCDLLFAEEYKKKARFAKKESDKKSGGAMKFSVASNEVVNKKPYGDLF